jgi:hypothetical protein
MNDIRDLLDREIGDPPPTSLNIDAIIMRQRRRTWLRQIGLGASVAALAAGSVLLATTLTGADSRSGGAPAGGGPRVTPHRTFSAHSTSSSGRSTEAQRVGTVLAGLMHQALPDAAFSASPILAELGEHKAGPLVFVPGQGDYLIAAAKITDTAGTASLVVRVGKTHDAYVQNRGCIPDPPPLDLKLSCHTTHTSGGALIVKQTSSRGAYKRDVVEVLRPGGNVVDVELANGARGYTAQRPSLNLTLAQLTALAENPELAVRR